MDMIPLRLTSSAHKEEETYLANLLQWLCTQQQEARSITGIIWSPSKFHQLANLSLLSEKTRTKGWLRGGREWK